MMEQPEVGERAAINLIKDNTTNNFLTHLLFDESEDRKYSIDIDILGKGLIYVRQVVIDTKDSFIDISQKIGTFTPNIKSWKIADQIPVYKVIALGEPTGGARIPDLKVGDTVAVDMGKIADQHFDNEVAVYKDGSFVGNGYGVVFDFNILHRLHSYKVNKKYVRPTNPLIQVPSKPKIVTRSNELISPSGSPITSRKHS